MIKVLIGDLFTSNMDAVVNTVNCVGIMGKGIAKTFKAKYPDMFIDYKKRCERKEVIVGEPYIYRSDNLFLQKKIINFPTKRHWRSPSNLSDVINGLDYFLSHYTKWDIKSIAFPPLGCGNGGLAWATVGKIMYQKLVKTEIDIEIFAPFGTPQNQLTKEFLLQSIELDTNDFYGEKQQQINPEWLPLLECIFRLQESKNKVGRVKFQKIAYIMTEMGLKTGFHFKQSSFGQYSNDLKIALNSFYNSNILIEKKIGRMTQLIVTQEYFKIKNRYKSIIFKNRNKINKTVDLFKNIQSSEQADEIVTIIYYLQELKKSNFEISEEELYSYIISKKKNWNTEQKKTSIHLNIRELKDNKWIKVNSN